MTLFQRLFGKQRSTQANNEVKIVLAEGLLNHRPEGPCRSCNNCSLTLLLTEEVDKEMLRYGSRYKSEFTCAVCKIKRHIGTNNVKEGNVYITEFTPTGKDHYFIADCRACNAKRCERVDYVNGEDSYDSWHCVRCGNKGTNHPNFSR